jgi:Na+-translocating ferredoxin:NAD+ oxidoreductase subunit G
MAKKLESTLKNMALSLFIICAIMAGALGYVYSITKKPIEDAEKRKVNDAIQLVVPVFDNDPGKEVYQVNGVECFPAKKGGVLVGTAVLSYSDKGFSGHISIMVGFTPDGKIYNTAVMSQKETPGLGNKMTEPKFRNQFNGKTPGDFKVSVKKDGGDVDAITAATISSRAFCDAVNRANECFRKKTNATTGATSHTEEGGKNE